MYTEKQALELIAKGDENAFEFLFFTYHPKLVRFIFGFTNDMEVSKDIAQNVFITIWNNKKSFVGYSSISPYLYKVSRNAVFNYFDHLLVVNKYEELMVVDNPSINNLEEKIFVQELQKQINEEIEKMSPKQRVVFVMSRKDGLSNQEIADKLGISKRTVENYITKSLAQLRMVIKVAILFSMYSSTFDLITR